MFTAEQPQPIIKGVRIKPLVGRNHSPFSDLWKNLASWELPSEFLVCFISGHGFGEKKESLLHKYLKEHKVEVRLKILYHFFPQEWGKRRLM